MSEGFDLLLIAAPGAVFPTRDRRQATILRIEREAGLVHGEVPMFGPCSWRADGIYAQAPCGAAGPLDLVAPGSGAAPGRQRRTTMREALSRDARVFCCD